MLVNSCKRYSPGFNRFPSTYTIDSNYGSLGWSAQDPSCFQKGYLNNGRIIFRVKDGWFWMVTSAPVWPQYKSCHPPTAERLPRWAKPGLASEKEPCCQLWTVKGSEEKEKEFRIGFAGPWSSKLEPVPRVVIQLGWKVQWCHLAICSALPISAGQGFCPWEEWGLPGGRPPTWGLSKCRRQEDMPIVQRMPYEKGLHCWLQMKCNIDFRWNVTLSLGEM